MKRSKSAAVKQLQLKRGRWNFRQEARGAIGSSIPDVTREKCLSLSEAAKLSCFMVRSKPASNRTMHRHRLAGLQCFAGRLGWMTTTAAIQRYFEQINSAAIPLAAAQAAHTQHNADTRALESAGI